MNEMAAPSGEATGPARFGAYDDTTYYGRAQLKTAPFQNAVVGAYIFVAGLSGSAALLAALADVTGDPRLEDAARRGRYLALLAPVVGSPLLIYDLHTPKRFYNMLRVAKATSPMSIGTWILMSFSATAGVAALAQIGADLQPRQAWLKGLARIAGIPAAVAGAGLSFYTAALMSATSTPVWAAAPRALAVRYGSSSVASAAAALGIGENEEASRAKLATIQALALVTEGIAAAAASRTYRDTQVHDAFDSPAGTVERIGAVGVGLLVPLGLLALSAFLSGRPRRRASAAASVATLAGSFLLRASMLSVGDESAARPDISFRFSTPENLPRTRS